MSTSAAAWGRTAFKACILALLFACTTSIADEPAVDEPAEGTLTQAEAEKLRSAVQSAIRARAKSEPSLCYQLVGGDGMTVGQAIELCGGTTDAFKTLACFEEAWGHPDEGGLGLNRGQAVDLCKSNSQNREPY